MAFEDTLRTVREGAKQARFRLETITRVGGKLGMHRRLTWPGAKLLLRSLSSGKGKTNPSLIFRFYAENDPDRTALVQVTSPARPPGAPELTTRRHYSYREMNETIDRIGLAMSRRGIGKGAGALLLIKNRIEFLLIQPALGRIGGSAIPASWRSTAPEIEYLARHSSARVIFFDADIADTIREVAARLSIPKSNFISVGGEVPGFASFEEIIDRERGEAPDSSEEGQVVMYTSGTTGKPKGAVRTFQQNALAGALCFIGETPMALGDVHLSACPLYHATAFGFCGFSFLLGGTIAVMSEFKAEPFLDAVQRHRVTTTALVPTMIHRLVELGPAAIRQRDLTSLRAIFSGGAPLSGPLAIEAMDLLGDKLWNFYGATETGIVTLASPADLRSSPGTIGRAIPSVEIRLLDEAGSECRTGDVGEVYARGPMLVDGYHADAEATRQSMNDGFFSVGDLARRDARGCFHIEGRKRDMIISGGVNVYPAEVEGVLHEHPAIAEASVVGVPDREWGERVRAFLVLRPGMDATDDDLKAYCKGRLSGPKVPRDYIFLESLPRNPTGKVLKRELRAMEGAQDGPSSRSPHGS
jgi:fatty-acyl-CoA synthase